MAAIKSGQLINPITDVAWHEIFPIKIAGITIAGASGNYDTPDPEKPGAPPPGSVEAEVSPGPPTFKEALRKEQENKE